MLGKTILTVSFLASAISLVSYNETYSQTTPINPKLQIIAQSSIADVETIAKNITVRVSDGKNRSSGILIAKNDNTYTVITNARVTDGETYTIQTPDGTEHTATVDSNNTDDLAAFKFNSSNDYQVATIGNSDSVSEGETVIAAGFPESQNEILLTEGKISLFTKKPLKKGYSIGFSNNVETRHVTST